MNASSDLTYNPVTFDGLIMRLIPKKIQVVESDITLTDPHRSVDNIGLTQRKSCIIQRTLAGTTKDTKLIGLSYNDTANDIKSGIITLDVLVGMILNSSDSCDVWDDDKNPELKRKLSFSKYPISNATTIEADTIPVYEPEADWDKPRVPHYCGHYIAMDGTIPPMTTQSLKDLVYDRFLKAIGFEVGRFHILVPKNIK